MSVIHNTQKPESVLKKNANQIYYHAMSEVVAMGECLTHHISTNWESDDLATKLYQVGSGWQSYYMISVIIDLLKGTTNSSMHPFKGLLEISPSWMNMVTWSA